MWGINFAISIMQHELQSEMVDSQTLMLSLPILLGPSVLPFYTSLSGCFSIHGVKESLAFEAENVRQHFLSVS